MSQSWASSHGSSPSCTPHWPSCSKPAFVGPHTPSHDSVTLTCSAPPLASFIKRCVAPDMFSRTAYVWATPRPRRRHVPHIVFLGLDNSGKTSIIQSLLVPPAEKGAAQEQGGGGLASPTSPLGAGHAGLPAAPPPTSQISKYLLHLGSSGEECVAVDLPGTLSKRALWLEALRHCDGVVVVVDSADNLRFRVVRAELHRIMPLVQRKALPCLVLATKQDMFTAKSKEEILLNTSLAAMCSHLPAPWTLKPCCVTDTADISQALCWLLAHAKELKSLVGEAAREKAVEYQARNLSYNLSKLQEMQEASYIKATTWA